MGILAYPLFFVPLIAGAFKTSPFVKFHTNQGILLWIVFIGYSIINSILSFAIRVDRVRYVFGIPYYSRGTPVVLSVILSLLYIPIVILCVMGIMTASKGEMKPLPVIGDKFTILK